MPALEVRDKHVCELAVLPILQLMFPGRLEDLDLAGGIPFVLFLGIGDGLAVGFVLVTETLHFIHRLQGYLFIAFEFLILL